jgi:hypothetical protein
MGLLAGDEREWRLLKRAVAWAATAGIAWIVGLGLYSRGRRVAWIWTVIIDGYSSGLRYRVVAARRWRSRSRAPWSSSRPRTDGWPKVRVRLTGQRVWSGTRPGWRTELIMNTRRPCGCGALSIAARRLSVDLVRNLLTSSTGG